MDNFENESLFELIAKQVLKNLTPEAVQVLSSANTPQITNKISKGDFDLILTESIKRIRLIENAGENLTDYLTVSEVCKFLKIGRTNLYNKTKQNILEHHRIGGRILYSRCELISKLSTIKKYNRAK